MIFISKLTLLSIFISDLIEVLDDDDLYFQSYLYLNAGGPLLQLAHLRPLPPLPQHVEPDGLAPLT